MQTARERLKAAILKAAEWEAYWTSMALKRDMLLSDKSGARMDRKNAKAWRTRFETLHEVATLADDIYPFADLSFDREIDNARQQGRARAFLDFNTMTENAA